MIAMGVFDVVGVERCEVVVIRRELGGDSFLAGQGKLGFLGNLNSNLDVIFVTWTGGEVHCRTDHRAVPQSVQRPAPGMMTNTSNPTY